LPAVPTQYRSSGCTSFFCASFCSRKPILRSLRTASWAAATETARPTVTGEITPGNSTVLRIGMTIIASSGSGLSAAPGPREAAAALRASSLLASTSWFMRLPSCGMSE
jgi:hypothetical protein